MKRYPVYDVQPRTDSFAVIRTGTNGAEICMGIWRMEHMAQDLAARLNAWSGGEIE